MALGTILELLPEFLIELLFDGRTERSQRAKPRGLTYFFRRMRQRVLRRRSRSTKAERLLLKQYRRWKTKIDRQGQITN